MPQEIEFEEFNVEVGEEGGIALNTVPLKCRDCDGPTEYCDSVPDPNKQGANLNECGYSLAPLCWLHAAYRREAATSRVEYVIRCESQNLARIDRGRASGDCLCLDCGREYRRHSVDVDHPYLNVLCDGSVVKL